jgi:uncharacterized membrane protein
MTRDDFLTAFRRGLTGLPAAQIHDLVTDYESHFREGLAAGRSEEEIAAALGDPARLARELRAETGFRRWENERTPGSLAGVVLALLGLATFDFIFLLPLLCAMAGIFFGLAVACLALVVAGSFLIFNLLPFGWHAVLSNALMQTLTGIGLISGAIGGGALLLLVVNAVIRLLIDYARLHFRLFNSASNAI